MSAYSFVSGTVPRRMALTRAEELVLVRGYWLHEVSASDFEGVRQQAGKAAAKDLCMDR